MLQFFESVGAGLDAGGGNVFWLAAGLDFLELLAGYDKVIVIDAIQTGQGAPGSVYRLEPDILFQTRHAGTPHDVSLGTALELGKRLGLPLPAQLRIFAIEVKDVDSFGEECTPEVMAAVPECVRLVLEEVRAWQINQS